MIRAAAYLIATLTLSAVLGLSVLFLSLQHALQLLTRWQVMG